MIHRLENDSLLTRVITNYSTLKEPFWPSQQGIPSNVFLIVRRISLIGSVFNIVLVEMDMCSGTFKGASFRGFWPKKSRPLSDASGVWLESVTANSAESDIGPDIGSPSWIQLRNSSTMVSVV